MKKSVLVVACMLLIIANAFGAQTVKMKSLTGLKQVKFVVDVNVGDAKSLLKRMELLDRTYRQLIAAGMKPVVVVAFRAKASFFITKGDGYVAPEEKDAKLEMKAWIERFKQAGFTIEQCAIAAEMLGIEVKDFLPQVEIVENGYVSLIGYQQQGYAFLPMD
ncbi:MAG: DsrE family protein [Nitrospirae bacterium]|nr:DsrE family protein [Nitrospirota bacterium]